MYIPHRKLLSLQYHSFFAFRNHLALTAVHSTLQSTVYLSTTTFQIVKSLFQRHTRQDEDINDSWAALALAPSASAMPTFSQRDCDLDIPSNSTGSAVENTNLFAKASSTTS